MLGAGDYIIHEHIGLRMLRHIVKTLVSLDYTNV
jgi:hypothetical protein